MEHSRTHIPDRVWCPYCVAGRGTRREHPSAEEDPQQAPSLSFDHAFLRNATGGESAVVMVGKEKVTTILLSHVSPTEGGQRGLGDKPDSRRHRAVWLSWQGDPEERPGGGHHRLIARGRSEAVRFGNCDRMLPGRQLRVKRTGGTCGAQRGGVHARCQSVCESLMRD